MCNIASSECRVDTARMLPDARLAWRLERPLRELIRTLNPDVPIADVETGDQLIAGANARIRFATFLILRALR
jgi:hypothetical protein